MEFANIKIAVDRLAGRTSPDIIKIGHNKVLNESLNFQSPSFLDNVLERKIRRATLASALV
jgi:hypothetical protein